MKFKQTSFLLGILLTLCTSCEKDPVSKPPTDNSHQCDTSFDVFGFWGLKTVNTVIYDMDQNLPIDTLNFNYARNYILMELDEDNKGYQFQNRLLVDSFSFSFDSSKLIVYRQPSKPVNDTFQVVKFDRNQLQMIQNKSDFVNKVRTRSLVSFERK